MAEGLLGGMLLGTVTSQMLLDLCLIAGWFYLIYRKLKGKASLPSPPFFQPIGIEWAIFGYFITAVLSLAINAPSPIPWFYSLRKFTWIADLFLMTWLFSVASLRVQSILIFFCSTFLLPNIYAVSGLLVGYDPITNTNISRAIGLVNSATYHAHGNGAILAFFLALLLSLAHQFSKKLRVLTWLAMLLMLTSILLTYTRGIWASVAITTLFILILIGKRSLLIGAPILIAICTSLFSVSPSIRARIAGSLENHGDHVRQNLYRVFWEMIKDHPIIGIGYWDQYRQIETYWPKIGLPSDYFTSHAHNQYLNVLGTTGVLGFFFFMSIVIYFVSLNVSLYRKSTDFVRKAFLLALLAVQVEYLIACITDVTFEYAKLRAILLLTWALLIALKRDRVKVEL